MITTNEVKNMLSAQTTSMSGADLGALTVWFNNVNIKEMLNTISNKDELNSLAEILSVNTEIGIDFDKLEQFRKNL